MNDKQKKVVRISTPEEIEAAKASIPRKLNSPEVVQKAIEIKIKRSIDNCCLFTERCLEYAMRHLITPVIKGEITRGKCKWRGLRIIRTRGELNIKGPLHKMEYSEIIGLTQRNRFININYLGEEKKHFEEWLDKTYGECIICGQVIKKVDPDIIKDIQTDFIMESEKDLISFGKTYTRPQG